MPTIEAVVGQVQVEEQQELVWIEIIRPDSSAWVVLTPAQAKQLADALREAAENLS